MPLRGNRPFVLIPLLLAGVAALRAQALTAQDPFAARIDRQFAAVDRRDSPGCAVGIYENGRIRYSRGYGMADVRRSEPLTPASIFEVASITKQFVAGLIGLLADQHLLSLDDDVRRYVPELPDFGRRITLRHLIHHTSGLPDFPAYQAVMGVATPDAFAARLAIVARRPVLNFAPGSDFAYTNIEYGLLQLVAERATQTPIAELAAARLWRPLEMDRSFLHNRSDAPPPGVATGYRLEAGAAVPIERRGATSVFTSVEDLQRWDENFYTGVVGGMAWARRMASPARLSNNTPIDYAFGNWVGSYRGLPVVRHDGSAEGYRTYLIRFPTKHLSVAILCNTESVRPLVIAHDIADMLLAGAFPEGDRTKAQSRPASADRWEGHYLDVLRGEIRDVAAAGANLRVPSYGDPIFLPLSGTRFRNGNGSVELEFTADRAGSATMRQRFPVGGESRTLTRVAPWTPTAAHLAEFAGTYENADLGATHEVTVAGDALLLRLPGERAPHRLQPIAKDIFADPRLTMVKFVRTADGRVTGYRVHMPRAWGIPFDQRQNQEPGHRGLSRNRQSTVLTRRPSKYLT
jgi:CubicO group peptidase (beta-lactamase class C family)